MTLEKYSMNPIFYKVTLIVNNSYFVRDKREKKEIIYA